MLKTPEATAELLRKRFASKHREWLTERSGSEGWPLELPLGLPSEAEASRNVDAVGAWAQLWRDWSGAGSVQWVERQWRNLGRQTLPERLVLRTPVEVAIWAGQEQRWARANERARELAGRWPGLEPVLGRYFNVLADYSGVDYRRLLDMLSWLTVHPASGLYPRQVPVAGLDSKWLEPRARLVSELLAAIQGDERPGSLYERCGLRGLPPLFRMRVLDRGLRSDLGELSDISAPLSDFVALTLRPARVLIIENIQTALALPDIEGAVVFAGLGYGVEVLREVPWIALCRQFYWGDCDTHGLAILNRARAHLPEVQSVLMDEATLLEHRNLCVDESIPSTATALPFLNATERDFYQGLLDHRWGQNLRLEQERIGWDYAMRRLRIVLG